MEETDVYARIGEDGFARLTRAFYAQVPGDAVLGPMYAGRDLADAEARLRDFLSQSRKRRTTVVVRESLQVPAADIGPYLADPSYP